MYMYFGVVEYINLWYKVVICVMGKVLEFIFYSYIVEIVIIISMGLMLLEK